MKKRLNRKIKAVSLMLVLTLCAGLLSGCGSAAAGSAEVTSSETLQSTEVDKEVGASNDNAAQDTTSETRIIVDHAGHEVEIPTEINSIAMTSITPLPSVYCMFAGSADKLIGISKSSKAAAENSLLIDLFPEIADIPTEFYAGNEINIEELLAMDPDVVFYNTSKMEEYDKLAAAGIPAIGVSTSSWGSDSIETFEAWVTLLGEVLGEEDKADGIAEYGREVYDMIQDRLANVSEEDKPSVLFLYGYSEGTITTCGSKHFGQYWADSTGAVNVTQDMDMKSMEINMEQVYEWDPDMIYITNFVPYLAEDLYNNSIEGQDWSVVRAVQDGQVYKCPLGVYRWYPPSSDTPLMLLWMAKTNHPDLFEDVSMEDEMKKYYQQFYGIELTDENIQAIFNPSREAAGV